MALNTLAGLLNIPLAGGVPNPDVGLMQQNQANALKLQQMRQQAQAQNALRQILAQPGAIDPTTGLPTTNALARVTQIDPAMGMGLTGDEAKLQAQRMDIAIKKIKTGLELVGQPAKDLYDEQVAAGIPEQQARQNAQVLYTERMKQLAASGLASPDEMQRAHPTFDPQRINSNLDLLQRLETQRHDRAGEANEAARTGIEGGQLALARERFQHDVQSGKFTWQSGMGRDPTNGQMTPGTWRLPTTGDAKPEFFPGVVSTPKGGPKWELLTDPTRKDASGNPVQYRYDPATGHATTLAGQPYTPGGAAKIGGGSSAGASLSKNSADRIARQYIAGDKSGMTGLGYGNQGAANRAMVQDAITAQMRAQGKSPEDIAAKIAEFSGITAGERTLGVRQANLETAVNEATGLAPKVKQAAARLDRGMFPTFNSLQNAISRGTGGQDVIRLVDYVNGFKNAYAQAVARGGQSTDDARHRADEVIDAAWSKGQINTALDTLLDEMQIVQQAPGDVRDALARRIVGRSEGGSGATAQPRKPNMSDITIRAQAEQAIHDGKDRGAVLDRLRAWGVSTDGL